MSMQKVSVMPPLRAFPRGALWLRGAVEWLVGVEARMRGELTATLEAVRTKLAIERAARREARSRADLFELARRYQATQPEFAKDLFAAAATGRAR